MGHQHASKNESESRHRICPPPAPDRSQRLTTPSHALERLQRKPSELRGPIASYVDTRLPNKRNLSHRTLRETFLLGILKRHPRTTESLHSPHIKADHAQGVECNYASMLEIGSR